MEKEWWEGGSDESRLLIAPASSLTAGSNYLTLVLYFCFIPLTSNWMHWFLLMWISFLFNNITVSWIDFNGFCLNYIYYKFTSDAAAGINGCLLLLRHPKSGMCVCVCVCSSFASYSTTTWALIKFHLLSGNATNYLLSNDNEGAVLQELHWFKQSHTSWFLGDYVSQGTYIYIQFFTRKCTTLPA